MPSAPATAAGPAQRLLDAAERLFDREGIRAVGIDRVLAAAGVARASLYTHFGSKDALVTAYLERADRNDLHRWQRAVRGLADDPLGRIRTAFELAASAARRRGYRGCLYLNAATEFPGPESPVATVVAEHRARQRAALRDALVQLGHPDPDETAARIQLVYDGGLAGSKAERSADPITRAAALAVALAVPPGTSPEQAAARPPARPPALPPDVSRAVPPEVSQEVSRAPQPPPDRAGRS